MSSIYPGDDIIPDAAMIYDRKRLVKRPPSEVFPWLQQLGWYITRFWERVMPQKWKASRTINPAWQNLMPGQRVEDYKMGMGEGEFFTVVSVDPPESLVYVSERLGSIFTWTLMCHARGEGGTDTLVHLRFRGRIHRTGWQRKMLVVGGDWVDWLFTEPMLSGLVERCESLE